MAVMMIFQQVSYMARGDFNKWTLVTIWLWLLVSHAYYSCIIAFYIFSFFIILNVKARTERKVQWFINISFIDEYYRQRWNITFNIACVGSYHREVGSNCTVRSILLCKYCHEQQLREAWGRRRAARSKNHAPQQRKIDLGIKIFLQYHSED